MSSSEPLPAREAGVPLLSAEEMRAWDRRAIDGLGIPERVLMESAGRSAAAVVQALCPRGPLAAAVGRGNNGGDAVVALRTLAAWGREVVAVPLPGAALPEELLHARALPTAPPDEAERVFGEAALVLDGVLGTGATGAPREPQAALIRAMNGAGTPVLALDGPSGVDLTTGAVAGAAVQAAATLCFGAPKRGLLLYPGRAHAGRLLVAEVGFPALAEAGAWLVTAGWARARLPRVAPNAHKGQLGTLLVVAGREGVAGAAALVAHGAGRTGVGIVRVASVAANRVVLQTLRPEALFVDRATPELEAALDAADAVVAGPGIGTDAEAEAVLRRVLEHGRSPLLLDADALTLLARSPELAARAPTRPTLLTPHPGEMARLLDGSAAEIAAALFEHATRAAERFGCAVLLKGWPSLVAAPGQPVLVNTTGHAGIATGGMGDTLAGVAGAFLARGTPPAEAAALALFFAGRAAEIAGAGRPLLPHDVAEALPDALARPARGSALPLPGLLLDLPAPA